MDRKQKIWRMGEGNFSLPKIELPKTFFDVTLQDSTVYAQSILSKGGRPKPTSAYIKPKQDASSKAAADFTLTRLRFRLPNKLFVEGTFRASDEVKDMYSYIRSLLRDPKIPFTLFIAPPRKTLEESSKLSLAGVRLVPSAVINIAFSEDPAGADLLREDLRATIIEPAPTGTISTSKSNSTSSTPAPAQPSSITEVTTSTWPTPAVLALEKELATVDAEMDAAATAEMKAMVADKIDE